ncbi:phytanoyl-CoA dioxygenase family protein [Pseudoprimorskyibacter insulae]|uniref:Phytanoyl-CoA dioxygenase n=1 Tax=Pseudoprimorskyibacter insulae TaxID=1695997 RepID=A0A2R8AY33_9RHOB|nr:phytanoyl-CoA dioxygenase family protein [Pseudoprimorskyibacter insulae]SPF80908.1 hypothetical protein PRI8871_02721 [Pseudoprimorskyibacter insulae]
MTGMERDGYRLFPADPTMLDWAAAAAPMARAAIADPAMRARWLTCRGTWFVGVDALANDAAGAVGGVPLGAAITAAFDHMGRAMALHPAQVSAVWPGYPQPRDGETEAAFRYRLKRDAAHVDGLKAGPDNRRHLDEPHAFILGIALDTPPPGASPLVVWPGSHRIIGAALAEALQDHPPERWKDVDLTAPYTEARRIAFDQCPRVELPLKRGEAALIHRHLLHGIAPWTGPDDLPRGRMVAYFRPMFGSGQWKEWL